MEQSRMINKKLILAVAGFFLILFSLSLSSAYYYGNSPYNYRDGYFNSYSYTASRSSGYYSGPVYTSNTFYDKTTTSRYLPDGTYETQTHYIKTTRESPYYRPGYYGYNNYSPYNRYYYQYPSYRYNW